MADSWITVLGSFVADLAFRTPRAPAWGETILGSEYAIGPGGKGSNQAVAAARLGGNVSFVGKVGRDAFGELARKTFLEEGIATHFLFESAEMPTGAASIVVDEQSGENAIVVVPGAGFTLSRSELDEARELIADSAVVVTQLEVQLDTVRHALEMASTLDVPTVFNPAPAMALPASIYVLCDFVTPNQSEAASLSGVTVEDFASAEHAADFFLDHGARTVVMTMGARGALVRNARLSERIPAVYAGPVRDTTGAGDAFNGAFSMALAEGRDAVESARFACAAAGIAVTRAGTAAAMPSRAAVEALIA